MSALQHLKDDFYNKRYITETIWISAVRTGKSWFVKQFSLTDWVEFKRITRKIHSYRERTHAATFLAFIDMFDSNEQQFVLDYIESVAPVLLEMAKIDIKLYQRKDDINRPRNYRKPEPIDLAKECISPMTKMYQRGYKLPEEWHDVTHSLIDLIEPKNLVVLSSSELDEKQQQYILLKKEIQRLEMLKEQVQQVRQEIEDNMMLDNINRVWKARLSGVDI